MSGEAYSPRGTLSAVGERKSMAGFLALKREKRDLQSKLGALRKKLQGNREEQERLKGEQSEVIGVVEVALGRGAQARAGGGRDRQPDSSASKASSARSIRLEKVTAAELAQLATERTEFERSWQAAATAEILDLEVRTRSGNEELREAAARLDSLKSENAALIRSLAAATAAHAVKQERRSGMESELRRLAGEAEDVRRRSAENGREKEAALARSADLQLERRDTETRIVEFGRAVRVAESDLEQKQKGLTLERESLAESDGALRRLHAAREEALNVRGRIEIEKTRLETDLEHLERGCAEEFHVPLSEIAAQIQDAGVARDYPEVSRRLRPAARTGSRTSARSTCGHSKSTRNSTSATSS